MQYVLILIMAVLVQRADAQTGPLQKEINEQVWKVFIKTFSNGDEEGFRSVHSRNVVRVSQDDNQVLGYDEYFQNVPDSIKARRIKWTKQIELRFIQRLAAGDKAFEIGYYKTTSRNRDTGESRTGYGKFHVLLRKENGVWKIQMDADANDGTDETVFQSGAALE